MKALLSVLVSFVLVMPAFGQTTLIQRVDMSHGNQPYYTSAVLLSSGWELWGFGHTHAATRDLEVGKLLPVNKKLLLGGYGVLWPDSGKAFAMPWATYNDKIGSAALNLNLAAYLPVNGGPTILFSDESSLVWFTRHQDWGVGAVASYWAEERISPMLRLGPTIRWSHGDTSVKVNYQPFYTVGKGEPTWRFEVSFRLK